MGAFPPPPEWAHEVLAVGVTGTNGKTSTTRWVASALRALGGPVARITTVGTFLDDEEFPAPEDYGGFLHTLTTLRERGGRAAALEVTSEALAMGFAHAWPMPVAVFTNLSHDHLDAHRTPEHYLASKAQLFVHLPPGGTAVLNAFDPASALLREVVPEGRMILTYGVPGRGATEVDDASIDLRATSVVPNWDGTTIHLAPSSLDGVPSTLVVRAIGAIFAENALAALGGAIAAGVPAGAAAAAIAEAPPPPGRFEVVARAPGVVVDYAHTPDALARTIATAKALGAARVIVVFGAGGDRDPSKRAAMGEAARGADRVVLTSDNPRGEDPRAIAAAIAEGLRGHPEVVIEIDRAAAITRAVAEARPDDLVVIAGKGHEATQTTGQATRPFSDAALARAAHAARG